MRENAVWEAEVKVKKKKKIWPFVVLSIILLVVAAFFISKTVSAYSGYSEVKYQKALEKGQKYMLEKNYEQAILAFAEAVNIVPKLSEPYMQMAQAYVELKEPEKALDVLQEGLSYVETGEATELYDYFVEVAKENNIDREPILWNTEYKTIKVKKSKKGSDTMISGDDLDVEISDDGVIYIYLRDVDLLDEYTLNMTEAGTEEFMWKLQIDCSLGSFGVYAGNTSDGSGNGNKKSVSEMDNGLIVYTFGKPVVVGETGVYNHGNYLLFGFYTGETIDVSNISVSKCVVTIVDSENHVRAERVYIVE